MCLLLRVGKKGTTNFRFVAENVGNRRAGGKKEEKKKIFYPSIHLSVQASSRPRGGRERGTGLPIDPLLRQPL